MLANQKPEKSYYWFQFNNGVSRKLISVDSFYTLWRSATNGVAHLHSVF